MDERATSAGFEHLFEHQEWVRALALRLSGDPASADDLVQETWLEALRSGRTPESPRAWLGGVVRNLARGSRRRAGARAVREERAAEHERLPSASELLERAELQRRVLAAVASLDEAYRVVVLLRYAEGLDGERIAARLGVPGSTVRSRLARALEQLRAKLDRDYGDRSRWAVVLASPLGAASEALAVGGGIVKAQLALAGALVAVAAAVWWPDRDDPERTAASRAAELVPERIAGAESVARRAEPAAIDAPERGSRAVAARVDRVLLQGRVIGPTDAELVHATLSVRGSDDVARSFRCGDDGAYSVFGLPPGPASASIGLDGFVPLRETFAVGGESERVRKDFTVERAFLLPVRFTDLAGEPLDLPRRIADLLAAVATTERPATIPFGAARRPSSFGTGRWRPDGGLRSGARPAQERAGVLEIRRRGAVWVSAVLRDVVLDSRVIGGDEAEIVFALDPAAVNGALASVVAQVVDGRDGSPIAGAVVEVGYRDSAGGGTPTDGDGRVTIAGAAPGMHELSVSARGYAAVHWSERVPAGERVDLGRVELFPTARVRGRVVDADGRGVAAEIRVVAVRHAARAGRQGPLVERRSTSDGAFDERFDVEAGPLFVLARHPESAPAVVRVDASAGDVEGAEIRLVAGTPVTLRPPVDAVFPLVVDVRDARGRPVHGVPIYTPDPVRIRLAPGEYALNAIQDDGVERTRALTVGAEAQSVEVGS